MKTDIGVEGVLEQLLADRGDLIESERLIHCLDLTLLRDNTSTEALNQLKQQAMRHQVAAICVFKEQLPHFSEMNDIKRAAVVNFPHGTDSVKKSIEDLHYAQQLGAQEIDYVLPYQHYLAGQSKKALSSCAQVIQWCKEQNISIKIIIETGAFTDLEQLYTASAELIELEPDFLKTSTGTIQQGASYQAVFTLLNAIQDANTACGIKISGGVKTVEQAQNYAFLTQLFIHKPLDKSFFRIGASNLLNELITTLRFRNESYED